MVICKIHCIASNRKLFPQVGLHLEANKNAVFLKKQFIFGIYNIGIELFYMLEGVDFCCMCILREESDILF